MKKALALFLALIVLGAGCMCIASASVLSVKDKVEFEETVLYGDKSIIEGVKVDVDTFLDKHLFWKTDYVAGAEPKVDTEYTFSVQPVDYETESYGHFDLNNYIDVSYSDVDIDPAVAPLQVIYEQLAEETPSGTEKTKSFLVSDYIDYYPIHAYISPSNAPGHFSTDKIVYIDNRGNETVTYPLKELQEYFRIPVLPDERLDVTIHKDISGAISHVGTGSTSDGSDAYNMWAEAVFTHSAAYFTISTQTNNGNYIDTSQIPGGYGIYRLPYHIDEKQETVIEDENIEMVYPLDPKGRVAYIMTDQEDENLLLFTVEDSASYLSVIDIKTMELQQKLQLAYDKNDSGMGRPVDYGDYLVMTLYENYYEKISVLTRDENGTYKQEFRTPLLPEELRDYYNFFWRNHSDYYAWNGKELLMCTVLNDEDGPITETPGFALAVYDASGIRYLGTYNSSLYTGVGTGNYNYQVRHVESDPLKVQWP